MKRKRTFHFLALLMGVLLSFSAASASQLQCANDIDRLPLGDFPGPEDIDNNLNGTLDPPDPHIKCMWIQGGDGYARMGDGYTIYGFSFGPVPLEVPETQAQAYGTLFANFPAPGIFLDQGDQLYLNLGNTGFVFRPDVDDPHTIHWHGFPEQSTIHDGVPEVSVGTKIGTIFSFWYTAVQPGTYFYHCHVEAPEHIQLGMIGNLYVRPSQNGMNKEYPPGSGRHYVKFAYNDGNGSTGYDVEAALMIQDFDRYFHDQFLEVQPDPFFNSRSSYPMINGRGYPDTKVNGPVYDEERKETACVGGANAGQCCDGIDLPVCGGSPASCGTEGICPPISSQPVHSLVEAVQGQKILLRLSNVSTNAFHTMQVLGIPMRVVGKDAKLLRGPGGLDLSYDAYSVTFGGGQSFDVILDTDGVPEGTYFLYSRNLNDLNNYKEARGGLMTEIVVSAP